MELSQLHFAYPLWLWLGLIIPLVWTIYLMFYKKNHSFHQLEKFIDSHLLPFLLVNDSTQKRSTYKPLILWTIVWAFLTLALAGPRWSFREMETFSKDQSLVILLDLSESMNATDIKPSRLVRAKQKIEDIVNLSIGVKIGLIAFAADPHMITPLTDDIETIRHLLPTLDTDLIYIQGSRLSPALEMASTMLESEPGSNKSLLVISDGSFEDPSAIKTTKKLADKGIFIYTMGVGTPEGAPIKDREGNIIKKDGVPILSKLDKEQISEISKIGNGRYLEAHYSEDSESLILNDLEKRAESQMKLGKKNRAWDEHFYLLILPILPVILWWIRRGAIFTSLLILFLPMASIHADVADYFKNTEQRGKQAMDAGDYEMATQTFEDPYRKGVSCYRAGDFAEAEKMFRQSSRDSVSCSALYNLGNSLVQQQKLKEAIVVYEELLQKWPEHLKAKENLELVKKMLEQQQQENSNSENSDQPEDQNRDEDEKKNNEQNQGSEKGNNTEENKENNKDKKEESSDTSNEERKSSDSDETQNGETNDDQEKESQSRQNENKDQASRDSDKAVADDQKDQDEEGKEKKSQADHDADVWLNRISNDPKTFMKNKFYIESKKNGTTEGVNPW